MVPQPVVNGLHVCQAVLIDVASREVTLTRSFRNLTTPVYPRVTSPFWAYAELYGPVAKGNLSLQVLAIDKQEMVYAFKHPVEFKDRFEPVYLRLNMRECRFPRAGGYEMILWVDLDIVAQRRFVISEGV